MSIISVIDDGIEVKAKPLLFNSHTQEVFLPVRNQPKLILTPQRANDGERHVALMNEPKINTMLTTPPFPYTQKDGEDWIKIAQGFLPPLLEQIQAGSNYLDGCPVHVVRYLNEDKSDILIGSIAIWRDGGLGREDPIVPEDSEEAQRRVALNKSKPTGDPTIVWTIGYWLDPVYHGKGYMTDILATLLEFATLRMNVKHIVGTSFEENPASMKVFIKNGFKQRPGVLRDYTLVKGRRRSLLVAEWTRD
ncbi:acyl-CoA N-acyltransferase [Flagelloscypha sp. PMI_526]|nr:acyl-CoA N-acyltransferase [Flagelloscypha sp. PMI_526]